MEFQSPLQAEGGAGWTHSITAKPRLTDSTDHSRPLSVCLPRQLEELEEACGRRLNINEKKFLQFRPYCHVCLRSVRPA